MGETNEQRIERLEQQVGRLRGLVLVVAVSLAAMTVAFTWAVSPSTISTADDLTVRKLTVVDAEGIARLVLRTDQIGGAVFSISDRDGANRISVATGPDGRYGNHILVGNGDGSPQFQLLTAPKGPKEMNMLSLFDGNGTVRVHASATGEGSAVMGLNDHDGKNRFRAVTGAEGQASVQISDQDEKMRILAGTNPDGGAVLSVIGRDEKAVWGEVSK
jgi:hypothetical protein